MGARVDGVLFSVYRVFVVAIPNKFLDSQVASGLEGKHVFDILEQTASRWFQYLIEIVEGMLKMEVP